MDWQEVFSDGTDPNDSSRDLNPRPKVQRLLVYQLLNVIPFLKKTNSDNAL